jgi:hypothetical protein
MEWIALQNGLMLTTHITAPQQHQQQESRSDAFTVDSLFSSKTAIPSSCHRDFTLNLDPQQKQKSSEFE